MDATSTPRNPLTFVWPFHSLPAIRYASRYALDDQSFATDYQSQTCHVLHIYDYPCTFRLGKTQIMIQPGDMTITPLGISARYDLPRPGYHGCVHFYPAREHVMKNQTATLPTHLSLGLDIEFALDRMKRISRLHAQAQHDPVAEAASSTTLLELLLWLTMLQSDTPSPESARTHSDRAVNQAVELIDQQIDQPLSVPKIARQVGLSQNYLAKRFRQQFSITISHYLLRRRIELAKQLLRSTNMPIHSIAQRVGLPDPHYFNKQFRRLAGKSPSAWRHNM